MRAVIQRVSESEVKINNKSIASIEQGLLILLSVTHEDDEKDADYLIQKVGQMRIFPDTEMNMNLSIIDIHGDILVVSQFTLHASTKKGNRPSFIHSAKPEKAEPLYEYFKKNLSQKIGKEVKSGTFGSMMKVHLVNDGPVTILIDSKNKN